MSVNELRHGKIENALGSLTVYLNGTRLDEAGATIDIDNGLGKLQVYVPKEFRVRLNADNGLGSINIHGTSSTDTNQPLLTLNVDNGLGTTDIYFE
ncbi:LiaF domain-containing protein [uncultured Streptococcus sp.]|uniref:LiaF domain-containing protein n=1 Tax=uncultured Streptococcus sp. TaxID=83427 RepID=UPI0025855FF2|nr:LiaF domain-containing protein [uncultured Streptococcus sp.]